MEISVKAAEAKDRRQLCGKKAEPPFYEKRLTVKSALSVILIILIVLTVLALAGLLLFRHFVTNQITDRGGMENPDAELENERMPMGGIHVHQVRLFFSS